MKCHLLKCFFVIFLGSHSFLFAQDHNIELRVLQFNIWQEGTKVTGGFDAIISEIIRNKADLIALSEVRNYNNHPLNERLVNALKEKGYFYYSERSEDSGIVSKYPIVSQSVIFPLENDHGSITKALINVKGQIIALYSGHLDYLNCALYLPRGYNGSTWDVLPAPVVNIDTIQEVNLASQRDEAIQAFIKDAKTEISNGHVVIYAGDNNEPSHLDWIELNKKMYDHNGVVMPWHNSVNLEKSGFIDVYRSFFPNPITHPGFTYPANNELVPVKQLAWSPKADDRDRIDFIFYYPDSRLKLKYASIIGPEGDIVKNKRVLEHTHDSIIQPEHIWPSDHKAILALFNLEIERF